MNKLGDIIIAELDTGLKHYCPHCQNSIYWRDYSETLPDKIAAKVEAYYKPKLLKIIDSLNGKETK